jgi:hypothetical protein
MTGRRTADKVMQEHDDMYQRMIAIMPAEGWAILITSIEQVIDQQYGSATVQVEKGQVQFIRSETSRRLVSK